MLQSKLQPFFDRYNELTELLSAPDISSDIKKMTELSKEQSSLLPIVEKAREYTDLIQEIADNKEMLGDPEMDELAKEELKELEPRIPLIEDDLKALLVPQDPNDDRNIFLEMRAGAGGDEAALFAEVLHRLYTKYAESRRWKHTILSSNRLGIGGFKEIIFEITGEGVYGTMKYESGVHRVQRVPVTESQGRIHTTTATVAVLPEVEDVEVEIDPNDLRIDVFRSSGPGGQSVNTTDSAVRVTHVPSGITISCQDEKSQLQNKDKALKILRARLKEEEERKQKDEQTENRRMQIGTGDRSERIRTYNYPQGRITDHRINLTLYKLEDVLEGNLEELITELKTADEEKKLEKLGV